MLQKSSGEIKH